VVLAINENIFFLSALKNSTRNKRMNFFPYLRAVVWNVLDLLTLMATGWEESSPRSVFHSPDVEFSNPDLQLVDFS